jgi:dynein heavy chain
MDNNNRLLNNNPLELIADAADIAKWKNEGLPNDSFSIQNAVIFNNTKYCPLLIDTELRGSFF